MKLKYINALMDMAERFAQTSEATRLKVGALIYRDGAILSLGINGVPSGWPSESCEGVDGQTLPHVRHAESAALEKLWLSTETSKGACLFVTHSPCFQCALKIKSAQISKVYFREHYKCSKGVDYLNSVGVECLQVIQQEVFK